MLGFGLNKPIKNRRNIKHNAILFVVTKYAALNVTISSKILGLL